MASKVVVFAKVATFCELILKKKLEVHGLGGEVLTRGNVSTRLTFRRCKFPDKINLINGENNTILAVFSV